MQEAANGTMAPSADSEAAVKLRSYQQEMLEASLKRNVIVAMDTGSGKTHVAIFRILAELERTGSDKLIWFITPSVALSEQQYRVISDHLPGYLVKTLLGKDGVDKWSDQALWDAFLTNVRVVVGTPAVLNQALGHGFVNMSRLSLLVFDEAHRCLGGSEMNSIMTNFYKPAKLKGDLVPHVLGLSASPVMTGAYGDLATIETSLDAKAITPTLHRSELEKYVHPPQMSCVMFSAPAIDDRFTPQMCRALNHAVEDYDLDTDPYIMQLREIGDGDAQCKLLKHVENPKTFCYRQLKALRQRCSALLEQLGGTAAEWYVRTCIKRYLDTTQSDGFGLGDINEQERKHLASIFQNIHGHVTEQYEFYDITEKVRLLCRTLNQHASPSLRGVVFVEQRAAVHSLANLLQHDPEISGAFSIGTFVGVSNIYSKTPVADLLAAKEQQDDLTKFRDGRLNLMIATNVLEEGIDVTACNLVICFDPPKNLVSFVQRRGRARQKNSKYVVFMRHDELKSDPSKWQQLEARMKQAYMDEQRDQIVEVEEEDDDANTETYRVESTGALLTFANAKAHLYHFCAVSSLHASRYIDLRPTFSTTNNGGKTPYASHVQLPSFVHPDVRTASSASNWRTEAAAIKDAAFQAYVALHKAGLVNDNLLPLIQDFHPSGGQVHVNQPSLVEVGERMSPWRLLFADTGYDRAEWHAADLRVSLDGKVIVEVTMWLPTIIPAMPTFPLYWNLHITYMVEIKPTAVPQIVPICSGDVDSMRRFTKIMLSSVHDSRMSTAQNDFVMLFSQSTGEIMSSINYDLEHARSATAVFVDRQVPYELGLVRVNGQMGRSFIFSRLSSETNDASGTPEIQIVATSFPKRRDFLHPVQDGEGQGSAYTAQHSFPINECTIDRLPTKYALLSAFAPSIMHRVELALLAQHLQQSGLQVFNISDPCLLVEALSAPAAAEPRDYNRLEFLGDSILKFCATLQVLAQHPNWPEGYLDPEKDRIINNNTLAKAALSVGLDHFIHNKAFIGRKWRPTYVGELLADEAAGYRPMSSKVLADVVEALIGAAYVDGGLAQSFQSIRAFLPEEDWHPREESINTLLGDISPCQHTDLTLLQQMVGYEFTHPTLLVEAVTHVSFPYNHTGLSYERLEFLGDAVLDLIIVPKLFAHPRRLKHWQLHNARKALVNGDFLGFCCMQYAIEERTFDVSKGPSAASEDFEIQPSARKVHLHDFLRAGGEVMRMKRRSLDSFEKLGPAIEASLQSGFKYPWPDLIASAPQKFLSDIIESILGAIYLDSLGDLSVCEVFLEKLKVFHYMQRILDEDVETTSNKEQLGILIGQKTVEYVTSSTQDPAGKRVFHCNVKIGDRDLASVCEGDSKEEAEARAASEAVKVLEASDAICAGANQRKRKLDSDGLDDTINHESTNGYASPGVVELV